MKKKPKVGVVGCGYWGPNLIRNFHNLDECTLKYICDMDEKRLARMKTMYPKTRVETDFQVLLDDESLDAIVVAVPLRFHYDLVRQSLQAGKHTFVEKPMAASSEQCAELIALADSRGLILMVGHTFLYSPAISMIKEIVAAGGIGHIRYITSRRLNLGLFQTDMNVVWDLAPHDLSIIMHLMGRPPVQVNCRGSSAIGNSIADVANTTLLFPDGEIAMIHNSWLDPKKVRDMAIVGDKKMIVYDDIEPLQKIRIHDTWVETIGHHDDNPRAHPHVAYHEGDMHAPHISGEEPLRIECRHFIECIQGSLQALTCGARGLELVRILEAASESLRRNGAPIDIPQDVPTCCQFCTTGGPCVKTPT